MHPGVCGRSDVEFAGVRRGKRWEERAERPLPWANGWAFFRATASRPRANSPLESASCRARLHRGKTRLPNVSFVCPLAASLETLASRTFPAGHWACSRAARVAEPRDFADLEARSDTACQSAKPG
jgi:hypothetical protein